MDESVPFRPYVFDDTGATFRRYHLFGGALLYLFADLAEFLAIPLRRSGDSKHVTLTLNFVGSFRTGLLGIIISEKPSRKMSH